MAALPKSGTPSPCSPTPTREHTFAGWLTGEEVASGDACQINSSNRIVRANGAAATDAARIDGFAAAAAQNGEAATLQHDVHFHYGAGLVPGTPYYLSGTVPGGLDTVASTGGTVIVARAISPTRLYVKKSW